MPRTYDEEYAASSLMTVCLLKPRLFSCLLLRLNLSTKGSAHEVENWTSLIDEMCEIAIRFRFQDHTARACRLATGKRRFLRSISFTARAARANRLRRTRTTSRSAARRCAALRARAPCWPWRPAANLAVPKRRLTPATATSPATRVANNLGGSRSTGWCAQSVTPRRPSVRKSRAHSERDIFSAKVIHTRFVILFPF